MRKSLPVFLILVFATLLSAFTSVNLVETQVGKVTLPIPQEFYKLNDQDVVSTFGMVHLPLGIYSNTERDIFIAVTSKEDSLTRSSKIEYKASSPEYVDDLKLYQMFQKSSLYNIYSKINIHTDTLVTIGTRRYMIMEFDSEINGENSQGVPTTTDHYNYVMHCFTRNKSYIINFSCPKEKMEKWKPIASEIMAGVKW